MLDYRIQTFLTLCKERNYSRTAQILNITQPAVTQHIQYLERQYNTKLFEYENKQLHLTKEGKILEKMALGLSASNNRIKEILHRCQDTKTHLKIGCTLIISECVLPQIIKELLITCPDVRLTMTVDTKERLFEGLSSGLYDCLYVEGCYNKEIYEHHLFSKEDYIAISGKKFPPTTKIQDLLTENVICREEGSSPRNILNEVLLNYRLSISDFSNYVECNNLTVTKELVKQQVGIAFVYKAAVLNELHNQSLYEIPLDLHLQKEFNFVILKNNMFAQKYIDLYHFSKEVYEMSKQC